MSSGRGMIHGYFRNEIRQIKHRKLGLTNIKSNRGAPEEKKKENFTSKGLFLLFRTTENGAG